MSRMIAAWWRQLGARPGRILLRARGDHDHVCEPSATATSLPPVMSLDPVNWVPWARSSTSASTFSAAMS